MLLVHMCETKMCNDFTHMTCMCCTLLLDSKDTSLSGFPAITCIWWRLQHTWWAFSLTGRHISSTTGLTRACRSIRHGLTFITNTTVIPATVSGDRLRKLKNRKHHLFVLIRRDYETHTSISTAYPILCWVSARYVRDAIMAERPSRWWAHSCRSYTLLYQAHSRCVFGDISPYYTF